MICSPEGDQWHMITIIIEGESCADPENEE
jgi:hypothetical protein